MEKAKAKEQVISEKIVKAPFSLTLIHLSGSCLKEEQLQKKK